MAGNRIHIVMDRPQSALEVHPPPSSSVNMAGVTVEHSPPRLLPAGGWERPWLRAPPSAPAIPFVRHGPRRAPEVVPGFCRIGARRGSCRQSAPALPELFRKIYPALNVYVIIARGATDSL